MEDYQYGDPSNTTVIRLDTGDTFLAVGNDADPRWIQWQVWIGLGGITQPFAPPTLAEPVQWALDNQVRAKHANRVLWRLWKSHTDQTKNAQNTLLDAFGILNDPSNPQKTFLLTTIIARKNLEGLGNTLTEADINAMSNADRRTVIRLFKEECLAILLSAVAGPGLAED